MRPWNWKASLVFVLLTPAIVGCLIWGMARTHTELVQQGVLPAQSQASHLAVPEQAPPHLSIADSVKYPYASALVVMQCKTVIGVFLVDHAGILLPQHYGDLSTQELIHKLSAAVDPDKMIGIEAPCGRELST